MAEVKGHSHVLALLAPETPEVRDTGALDLGVTPMFPPDSGSGVQLAELSAYLTGQCMRCHRAQDDIFVTSFAPKDSSDTLFRILCGKQYMLNAVHSRIGPPHKSSNSK